MARSYNDWRGVVIELDQNETQQFVGTITPLAGFRPLSSWRQSELGCQHNLNFALYPLRDIRATRVWKQGFSHTVIFVILRIGVVTAAIAAALSFMIAALALLAISLLMSVALHLSAPSTYVLRLTLPDEERDALMARDHAYLLRVIAAVVMRPKNWPG